MRVLLAATVAWLALLALATGVTQQEAEATHSYAKVDGHSAGFWRAVANRRGQKIRRLETKLTKRWHPSLEYGIKLAAVAYRQPASELRRVMWCESRFFLFAVSSGGHQGPAQFAPSTWASTPYQSFSPFDPIAAPLATGWMWQAGRKGEWACA